MISRSTVKFTWGRKLWGRGKNIEVHGEFKGYPTQIAN